MLGDVTPEALELRRQQREKDKLLNEVVNDILTAKKELDTATQNYNFADTDDMIDLYAYRIIAAQTKYNLLIKKARENGLSYQQYLNDVKAIRR